MFMHCDHVRIVNVVITDQQDLSDCRAKGQCWQVEGAVHRRLMGNKVTNALALGGVLMYVSVTLSCSRFEWEQTNTILGHSMATITWDIPPDVATGTYRIQHFGYHKPLLCECALHST